MRTSLVTLLILATFAASPSCVVAQESSPSQVTAPQTGETGKSGVTRPAEDPAGKQSRPTGGSSAPT